MPEWFLRLDGSHLTALVLLAIVVVVCATWAWVAWVRSDRG